MQGVALTPANEIIDLFYDTAGIATFALVYVGVYYSGPQRHLQYIDNAAATSSTPITGFANRSYRRPCHTAPHLVTNLVMNPVGLSYAHHKLWALPYACTETKSRRMDFSITATNTVWLRHPVMFGVAVYLVSRCTSILCHDGNVSLFS